MGNKPHHSGHYGGGVDLSKGKTPHDSLMKYMPVDDKGSSILNVGKPYSMGATMRGPLDKHGKVFTNSWEEEDVKKGKKEMKEGHYKHGEALFDDAHGSWNWSKSHHSTGAEMRGPLNKNLVSMKNESDTDNKEEGMSEQQFKRTLTNKKRMKKQ